MRRTNLIVIAVALALTGAIVTQAVGAFSPCTDECSTAKTDCVASASFERGQCNGAAENDYNNCSDWAYDSLYNCRQGCGGVGQPPCIECNIAYSQDLQGCRADRDAAKQACTQDYNEENFRCTLAYNDCMALCSNP